MFVEFMPILEDNYAAEFVKVHKRSYFTSYFGNPKVYYNMFKEADTMGIQFEYYSFLEFDELVQIKMYLDSKDIRLAEECKVADGQRVVVRSFRGMD